MATNEIAKTTTYSGTDIEVIVFRDTRSPAQRFEVGSTQRELKEIENQREELNKRRNQLQAQTGNNLANASTLRQFESANLDSLNSSAGESGKFQNQQNLLQFDRNSARAAEAAVIGREISNLETKRTELVERRKSQLDLEFFSLGSIHTVSYSSFREKFAVRTLGKTQAKGYTRGPRTIAGTMVFNVLQEHELFRMLKAFTKEEDRASHPGAVMLDQLDPFNVLLLFANEFGAYSTLHLFNVDIQSEGQGMSVDNIITTNSMQFYATDMIPMTSIGNAYDTYSQMIENVVADAVTSEKSGSSSTGMKNQSRIDLQINNPFANSQDELQSMLAASRGLF